MRIKGFDKNLCCRGMQFEIGKTYDTGAKDDEIELCTNTVFHYCKTMKNVHSYYNCTSDNRFCEIDVLGAEITDGVKCGSNKIKIIREITGYELDILCGKTNGNAGLFNTGHSNTGDWNTGHSNTGDWNTGDSNTGNCNTGDRNTGNYNAGDWNTGDRNTGNYNAGDWNTGDRNTGNYNAGDCNTGYRNTGNYNAGDWNTGDWNTGNCNTGNYNAGDCNAGDCNAGHCNTGNYNAGDCNTGLFNTCDFSCGVFCTESPKINIFNVKSEWTMREFMETKYYDAIVSAPLILTEWVKYTDDEKRDDSQKNAIGGYLKQYTFHDACKKWWGKLSSDARKTIMEIPNFDPDIFFEITGIKTGDEQ